MKDESVRKSGRRLGAFVWLVTMGAILGVGLWYYFKTQNELLATANEVRQLKSAVSAKFESSLHRHDSTMLELVSEPFSWAIRNELLEGNISTVHQYLAQFVKHKEIEMIAVIDDKGEIIASTNKKMEAMPFISVFPEEEFEVEHFHVRLKGDRQYVYHPIMGFDRKLGTLFIIYFADLEISDSTAIDNSSS